MTFSKTGIVTVSLVALLATSCQSQRFAALDRQEPEPLQPSPSGEVDASELPPPSQPLGTNDFPEAPGEDDEDDRETDFAALDSQSAAEVSQGDLVGSWKTDAAGSSCQMFLTLTEYGDSSRGGTRGCSGQMANVRAWDIVNNQVVLYDDSGQTLARLRSIGAGFEGQTSNGEPVSLSR